MSQIPITKLTTKEKEKAVNDILTLKKNIDYYYNIGNQFESKEKVIQILDELENLIKNNQNPSIKTPERFECYSYPCDEIGVNGTLPADVNKDGNVDVLDVVQIVQIILDESDLDDNISIEEKKCIADVNGDGNLDILDVVQIVQVVLGESSLECFGCPAGEVELWGECYSIANTTAVSRPNEGLEGEIPERICDLINLEGLYLYENRLIGSIPNCMGNMVNLEGEIVLQEIDLANNNLSGTIQSSFCNLLQLNDALGEPYNNGLIEEGNLNLEENNFCPEDLPWCFQISEESIDQRPECPAGQSEDECGNCCLNYGSDPGSCCSPTQGFFGGCVECPDESNYNYVCPEQTYLCQSADYQISDWMIDIADDFIDGSQQCNGCGDETALNYNSNAQVDFELIGNFPSDYSTDNPGLCEYETILTIGCTDGEACNFYEQDVCTQCENLGFGGCTTGPGDESNPQDEPCPNTHNDTCLYDPYDCGCGIIYYTCLDGSIQCHEENCPQCPEGQTECDNGDCVDDADDCPDLSINPDFIFEIEFEFHARQNLQSIPAYIQGLNVQTTDMSVENFAKYFTPSTYDENASDAPCIDEIIGEGLAADWNSVRGWQGSLTTDGLKIGEGYWFRYIERFDRPDCFEFGEVDGDDVKVRIPVTRTEVTQIPGQDITLNNLQDPFYLSFEEAFAYYPNLSGDGFSLEDIYLGNIGYGIYSNLDNFILGTYGEFTIDENEYIPSRLSNTFNEFCTCEFVGAEQCVENYLATDLLSCSDLNWGAPLREKNWSVLDGNETGLADLEGSHAEFVYNETAIKNPYTISLWGDFADLYQTVPSLKYLNIGLRLQVSFKENIVNISGVLGSGEITQHPDCGSAYNPPVETANTCVGAPPVGLGIEGEFTFPETFNLQQELNKDVSNLVLRCDDEGNKQFFVNGIGSNILENTIPESSDYDKNLAYIDLEDLRVMGGSSAQEQFPSIRFDEVMIYNDVIDISNIYSNGLALNPENSLNLIHWWRMGDGERDSVHDIDEFDFVSLHAISDSAYNSFEPNLVTDPSRIYELNLENPVLYLNDEILSENLIDSSAYRVTFNARVLDSTKPIKLGFASYRDARAPYIDCPGPTIQEEKDFYYEDMASMIRLFRCDDSDVDFSSNDTPQPFYNTENECNSECNSTCYEFSLNAAQLNSVNGWPLRENELGVQGLNMFIIDFGEDNYFAFECNDSNDCRLPIKTGQSGFGFPNPNATRNGIKFCQNLGYNEFIEDESQKISTEDGVEQGLINFPECYTDVEMTESVPINDGINLLKPEPGQTYYCKHPQYFAGWNAPYQGDGGFSSGLKSAFGIIRDDGYTQNHLNPLAPQATLGSEFNFFSLIPGANEFYKKIRCKGDAIQQPLSPNPDLEFANCRVDETLHPYFLSHESKSFSFNFFARGGNQQDYPDYAAFNLSPTINDIKFVIPNMPEGQTLYISDLTVRRNPGRPLMHRPNLNIGDADYNWDANTQNGFNAYVESDETITRFITTNNQCYDFDTVGEDIIKEYFNEITIGEPFTVYDIENQYILFNYQEGFTYHIPLDTTSDNIEAIESFLSAEVGESGDNFYQATLTEDEYAIFTYEENYQYGVSYLDFLNDFYLGIFNPTPDEDLEYNWYDTCLEPDFDGFCFTFEEQDNGMSRVRFILDISGEGSTGFRFDFPQLCVTSVVQSPLLDDFVVSLLPNDENANAVLGYTLTGGIIPNGEYLTGDDYLIDIECNTPGGCTECFGDSEVEDYIIISNQSGQTIDVTYPQPPPPGATPFEGFLDLDDWFMGGQSNTPINNILTELDDTINYSLGEIINGNGLFGINENGLPNYAVFNYQENASNTPFEYLDRAQVVSDAIASVDVEADNVQFLYDTITTGIDSFQDAGYFLYIDFDENGNAIFGSGEYIYGEDELFQIFEYQEDDVTGEPFLYISPQDIGVPDVPMEYPDIALHPILTGNLNGTFVSIPFEQEFYDNDFGEILINSLYNLDGITPKSFDFFDSLSIYYSGNGIDEQIITAAFYNDNWNVINDTLNPQNVGTTNIQVTPGSAIRFISLFQNTQEGGLIKWTLPTQG